MFQTFKIIFPTKNIKKPTKQAKKLHTNKNQQKKILKHTKNNWKTTTTKIHQLNTKFYPGSQSGLALHILLGRTNCRDATSTSAPAFPNNSQLLQWGEQKPIPKFRHSTILTSKDKTHSPFMSWHKAHALVKFHFGLLGFLQWLFWVFPQTWFPSSQVSSCT